MENLPMISALVGVAGVVFAAILAGVVKGAPAGNEKMREIADAISEGAIAYLNRQLITMSMTGIVIIVIIWLRTTTWTTLFYFCNNFSNHFSY